MRAKAKIQAVTFDVGGTLIEPWPSVGQVYAEVAARNGVANLSPAELQRRFVRAFHLRSRSIHSPPEWAEIVDETFDGLVDERPSTTFFPELYERFAQASAWRIYDDVAPTVAALAQRGLKLGVISNWDGRLRPLLKSLQLAERFDSIVVSCEVGESKPSCVIFEAAVAQLGVPATAIFHVGDSFEMDVQGARAAGLNAVQIERTASPAGGIKSLFDLLALV